MGPLLYFLGTGTEETRGELSEGGFLLKTDRATLHFDPGPGAAQGLRKLKLNNVDALVISSPARAHDANLITATQTIIGDADFNGIHLRKHDNGFRITHTDGSILYLTEPAKPAKQTADVLILATHKNAEKLITTIKPKLVILTGYTQREQKNNPVYLARELQKNTGIQTIAAQDNLTVDLDSYSAIAAQKSLEKFTTDS